MRVRRNQVQNLLDAVDKLVNQLGVEKRECVYCGEEYDDSGAEYWGPCPNMDCSFLDVTKAYNVLNEIVKEAKA